MADEKQPQQNNQPNNQPTNQTTNFEAVIECEKKRSQDYLNRLMYLQADFENLKKRFDRETEQIKNYCNERLVTGLLDIVDELELAIKNGEISTTTQGLLEGVEMTLKKLKKVLEQEGVTPIDNPEGKTFDPTKHNAIATVELTAVPDGTVVEEIRKGYVMRGKVLRPTIVKVAVNKSQDQNQNPNQNLNKNLNQNQNQSNKTEEKTNE